MNTQQRIENLHKEIEKLKRAMADTDVPFTIEAITEEIDEKEKEIIDLLDKQTLDEWEARQQQWHEEKIDSEEEYFARQQQEYPEGDNFIDMSGATDNGDR